MSEGTVAESPDGRHLRPWFHPVQPGVKNRSAPASPQSLQSITRMAPAPESRKPKLLNQVREAIRMRHYSVRTEDAYVGWIKRFILFHGKRHPREMGQQEAADHPRAACVE